MTTSLKDVSSAQMIHSLVEMNCFAQECSVYGYMWKDRAGRIKYTTSADETVIQRSFEQKVLESYELSPIKIWTVREIIKEETKDDLWMYLKLVLCDKLKENFNADYFSILHDLISVAPDDQARDILLPWMEELDGYYDEASLQLFEGAVAIAAVSKHLKPETYGMIKSWLQKTRIQIFSRMSVQDNYERTFGGFAYENGAGGYVLFCNANPRAISDRRKEMEQRRIFHTPLYTKQYWYHAANELKDVRARFQTEMKQLMNETYFLRIDGLRNLEHEVLAERWTAGLEKAGKQCSEEAVNGLLYWGYRWNLNMGPGMEVQNER